MVSSRRQMGKSQRILQALGVVGALLATFCPRCPAAETDAFVRLVWIRGLGADSCAGQLEVERQVRWRLGRDPFVLDAKRLIEARVSLVEGTWHAEIAVHDNTGAALGQRVLDVRADNCAEVVDAVGLAVALTIDPNVSLDSKVPPLPNSEPLSQNGRQLAPTQAPAEPNNLRPFAQLYPIFVPQPTVNDSRKSSYDYELSLRGLATSGLIPGVAPGIALWGAFGQRGIRLSLGLSYLPESKLNGFSFGLTTASLGLCADVFRSKVVAASVCGALEVGAIHAVILQQLAPLHPGDHPFAALDFGPKVGWRGWAPFFVEVGANATIGFDRPIFEIRGESPVFQSKLPSGVGFVGVGVVSP